MEYLIGLLVLALGGLLWNKKRADNAEALNDNVDTKTKVITIEEFIAKNRAMLDAEKAKRDQLEADLKAKENKDVSKDEILDYLNDPNKPDNK